MSSDEIAIRVSNLGKYYTIYEKPRDRLKQFIFPRLARLLGKTSKNYFREFKALNNISFEIKKGETVGIIGRNGAGKSTLLQMISGTLTPTLGEIQVNGKVAALLELGSGFNPEFTGRENIYLNAAILGLDNQQIDERYCDIVAFSEIGEFIDQPVKSYSSGMFVRLAFSIIAHVDAEILIIDEALAVGDIFFTQKCMRFLRDFMKTGTVLFVSHDVGAVTGLCQKAIWLEHGENRMIGSVKKITEAYLEPSNENRLLNSLAQEDQIFNEKIDAAVSLPSFVESEVEGSIESDLKNYLKVFEFTPGTSAGFGDGRARIKQVQILSQSGLVVSNFYGGERVNLLIEAETVESLESPIIGFYLKDRLGQVLFGDNTYLTYRDKKHIARVGSNIKTLFNFEMPILPAGDYSFAVALASGTQENHTQHHWVHDALIIRSQSPSICTGLIGIPIKISISILDNI